MTYKTEIFLIFSFLVRFLQREYVVMLPEIELSVSHCVVSQSPYPGKYTYTFNWDKQVCVFIYYCTIIVLIRDSTVQYPVSISGRY